MEWISCSTSVNLCDKTRKHFYVSFTSVIIFTTSTSSHHHHFTERFRHRFLERNRPWILQHLVELLTPRSLDKPGPDGRPAIEYVRDVYAELMAMGEGMRRAGDRADISSDEDDELEAARRNWPRTPLVGAALAIARLWLGKARKRRAFSKLVRGIIDKNVKSFCDVCARTPEKNNVKLMSYLASRGEPDPTGR